MLISNVGSLRDRSDYCLNHGINTEIEMLKITPVRLFEKSTTFLSDFIGRSISYIVPKSRYSSFGQFISIRMWQPSSPILLAPELLSIYLNQDL